MDKLNLFFYTLQNNFFVLIKKILLLAKKDFSNFKTEYKESMKNLQEKQNEK